MASLFSRRTSARFHAAAAQNTVTGTSSEATTSRRCKRMEVIDNTGFWGLKRRPTLGRDRRKGPLMKQAAPPEFAHELPPDPDGSALQCSPGTKRRALPFCELSGLSNQWNHSIPTALTAPQVKTPVQRTVIVLSIVTAEIAIQLNRS